ncbi:MAG TPA: TIGR00341 family protein [Leptolyngbyaceae cyanobacterium M33_DOE_097]|uniref:TIGR00341 family protein n=1 Tax=Oscillatoriales cyanobacterium SpSt-418 TaxID=2282169 RepID=A0A7C3KB32_9CYAN|nr:TIGR00341 family protein [Leptolyngbyaceae cyanobacterium M33_DOE_097]
MRFSLKRAIVRSRQYFRGIQASNSGNWTWLASKPVPLAALNRSLWRTAEPSLDYLMLLVLSATISVLGLLADSAATIIGAMIVAPLMGPISGIAFSVVMANRRLLKRSLLSLIIGILMVIGVSMLISRLTGLTTLTAEIQGRTAPTLLDLGVALAAGAAGAYAKSRRGIADALAGVAIAVALVPPLSVVGIGISLGSQGVALGALLLFATNLVGIVFSGSVIFLWQRYGSISRAKEGLVIAIASLGFLAIPLGFSFQDLIVKQRTRDEIRDLISRETVTFAERDIRRFNVQRQGQELLVEIEVATRPGAISERQVKLVQSFLEKRLGQPIRLEVTLIPSEKLTAE